MTSSSARRSQPSWGSRARRPWRLPNKSYVPGIVPSESLRNLVYPLDWRGIVEYVGLPCVLKDAHGGGWKEVYICHTLDELIHHYDNSGLLTMVVQEFVRWEQFVRCICIGQEEILPTKYDPKERRYILDHAHLSPEVGARVVRTRRPLCGPGYDMNSIEFAIRDGVPYAIDFMNPAPDMDVNSLTPHYFEWVVKRMADLAIRLALEPRPQAREMRWHALFGGKGHASTVSSSAAGRPLAYPGALRAVTSALADAIDTYHGLLTDELAQAIAGAVGVAAARAESLFRRSPGLHRPAATVPLARTASHRCEPESIA